MIDNKTAGYARFDLGADRSSGLPSYFSCNFAIHRTLTSHIGATNRTAAAGHSCSRGPPHFAIGQKQVPHTADPPSSCWCLNSCCSNNRPPFAAEVNL